MAGGGARRDPGRRHGARLDQIGNTTKALTKGFAIATAVVAAIALFRSFIDEAGLFLNIQDILNPRAPHGGGVLSARGDPAEPPPLLLPPPDRRGGAPSSPPG